jgi:hypothetical protein
MRTKQPIIVMALALLTSAFLIGVGEGNAQRLSPEQYGYLSIDSVEGATPDFRLIANQTLRFWITLFYDDPFTNLVGLTNGFRVYSPDGATWEPILFDTANGWGNYFDSTFISYFGVTGSGADTVGISAGWGSGILGPFSQRVWWIETRVYPEDVGKTLCIDSSFFPINNLWLWATGSGTFPPDWYGPYCYEITSPLEPTPGKVKHNIDGFTPPDGDPQGTQWHELWPNYCQAWQLDKWQDNGDAILSVCDTLIFVNLSDGRKSWEHVELVTPTITVTTQTIPQDTMYLDGLDPNPLIDPLYFPLNTTWHEVFPGYCGIWQIVGWTDNGNEYLDSCDYIMIQKPGGVEQITVHVEAYETDIVTTPLPTPGDQYDHNIDGYFPPMGSPVGTWWHELWPNFCTMWVLVDWKDNGDGYLSYCDTITFSSPVIPDSTIVKHIEEVTGTIKVEVPGVIDSAYFDYMCGNPMVNPITDPVNTFWHEVWPEFSIRHMCVGWTDNGNEYLDSCDWIDLMVIDGPDSGEVTSYHVLAWQTDIVASHVLVTPPDTCEFYKAPYNDYSPFGVPDFDQKQDNWFGELAGVWTHCGPVALADCFWWIDSRFEDPNSPPPPEVNDTYPLVEAYAPTFIDDHDPLNVIPFVDSLATYCNTNVSPPPYPNGTWIQDLFIGATRWIEARGLDTIANHLEVKLIPAPDYDTIKTEVLNSEDVIFLLGFYEQHGPDIYCRLGGHYVTVAGVCTTDTRICISDPWFDKNEGEPPAGSAHESSLHNDAQNISGPHGQIHHDSYNAPNNPLPDPTHPVPPIVELTDYPDFWPDISNFAEMNQTDPPMDYCQWAGGPVFTMVEYAVVISPCCIGIRGNVDGDANDQVNVADLTYLVDYLFRGGPEPPCPAEADVNGDDNVNVADLTFLVDYLFRGGPAPVACP